MKKKIICQILLICLTMLIVALLIQNTFVYADSVAGINCTSSVNKGSDFTVSLILPSNADAAEATITVKYSDGSTSSQRLVYYKDMINKFPNSVTLNAKVAGTATVTASNIVISDESGNAIENGGTKSQSLNIIGETQTSTPSSSSGTTSSGSSNSGSSSSSSNSNSGSTSSSNTTVTFSDTNETVYTTTKCNIRSSYSTSSSKIATVNAGTSLTRTGTASNGWSRVNYNGQTAYVYSQYLTTTAPSSTSDDTDSDKEKEEVTFKDVNETMYASTNCNLRKSYSTDSDKVGYLMAGDEVTRTGVASNGWSRIKYEGNTVYVATRLLSTEKPEETENDEEVDEEKIDEEEIEVIELTEEETLQEEIGVLPEVGNNIATTVYYIVTVIAGILVVSMIYINRKFKEVC